MRTSFPGIGELPIKINMFHINFCTEKMISSMIFHSKRQLQFLKNSPSQTRRRGLLHAAKRVAAGKGCRWGINGFYYMSTHMTAICPLFIICCLFLLSPAVGLKMMGWSSFFGVLMHRGGRMKQMIAWFITHVQRQKKWLTMIMGYDGNNSYCTQSSRSR